MSEWTSASRAYLPIILIRGFGGLSTGDERRIAYQGFNEGSVYPHKRGENYIYEGFVLRLMKGEHAYSDATNIISYFASKVPPDPGEPNHWSGDKIVADRDLAGRLRGGPGAPPDPWRTFWVYRYYDLEDREFPEYGLGLRRLVDMIRAFTGAPKVNIVAHSMGGLIVREAIQSLPEGDRWADDSINKIITMGTPHQGISFQVLGDLRWLPILRAGDEISQFDPDFQKDAKQARSFHNLSKWFPLERMLCVVGTDFRSYSVQISSVANRLFAIAGEFGANYNRSDGLVKQTYAQVPKANRTFVHKCHGGGDSLMTARESYEVATRFLFGDVRVRVRLAEAKVMRALDIFGRSEIFFGIQVKSRRLDFDLFHQSAAAENCYGPFRDPELTDAVEDLAFGWAGDDRLIWQGYLSSQARMDPDIVLRVGVYVSERDLMGVGFSDNIIFAKQYFVRAVFTPELCLEVHENQDFQNAPDTPVPANNMETNKVGWLFPIGDGRGFDGKLQIEFDYIAEADEPVPLRPGVSIVQVPQDGRFELTGVMVGATP